jgi:hypothetical protein
MRVWAMLVAVAAASALVPALAKTRAPQTDLDALMQKVLARRDENWKQLQQYILDERDFIDVRGASNARIWAERREYQWFPRDGFFVRSPLSVNGVSISEADRRDAEDRYFRWVQARDQADPTRADGRSSITIGTDGIRFSRGVSKAAADDPPAGVTDLIRQRRQPEFIESAYVLRFSFDGGRYAFVGRERLEGLDVLRVEYYPKRLYKNDDTKPNATPRDQEKGDLWTQMFNKAALVTLWIEPRANQTVKYTFDNVSLDFLPAAWLMRPTSFKASMTMSQAFKGVWLPKTVQIDLGAMFATGPIDVRYRIEYRDYREATTSGRIKR